MHNPNRWHHVPVRPYRENTVALQGTLDTFALPDVLRLLATTKKTGQLLVQGDQGNGSLFLDSGSVVGGGTSLAETEAPHEVLFELLRLDDGSFMFDQDANVDDPTGPVDVEEVIEAAEAAHAEWKDLSTVVPSLDVGVVLAEDLPDDATTIDRDRWKLIVTIGSGTTVRRLGDRLGLTELPVLRATRALVDDGLATIGDAADDGLVDWDDGDDDGDGGFGGDDLPSLDDDTDSDDLFGTSDPGSDVLPEPLPDGSIGEASSGANPSSSSSISEAFSGLSSDQRAAIEHAVEVGDRDTAERLLDELPEGAIGDDLMRRFLGSVRS